jgi:uncharacterized protein involved in oxidation of intracellular sulfur
VNYLFVMHDPPYGTERTYNGIRWAREMLNADGNEARVFLFGDAVVAVMDGQTVPNGYYNVAKMVRGLLDKGAVIGTCGTCLDARGMTQEMIIKGAHRSSMSELGTWTAWADKIINV